MSATLVRNLNQPSPPTDVNDSGEIVVQPGPLVDAVEVLTFNRS